MVKFHQFTCPTKKEGCSIDSEHDLLNLNLEKTQKTFVILNVYLPIYINELIIRNFY